MFTHTAANSVFVRSYNKCTVLGEEGFCSKAALLGLTEEDIGCFELKKGEMPALRTAVGQLQAEGGGGLLAP